MQQPSGLPGNGGACVDQANARPGQRLQQVTRKGVVRAAQHQCVNFPGLSDKKTHSPRITCASSYYFCSIITAGAAFVGVRKIVAGLQHELRNANDGQVGMLGGEVDEKIGSVGMENPVQVSSIFRRIGKDMADCEVGYHVHNIAICGTANVIAAIDGAVAFVEGAILGAKQVLTMLQVDLPSTDAA